jgi:hypothetical protein
MTYDSPINLHPLRKTNPFARKLSSTPWYNYPLEKLLPGKTAPPENAIPKTPSLKKIHPHKNYPSLEKTAPLLLPDECGPQLLHV